MERLVRDCVLARQQELLDNWERGRFKLLFEKISRSGRLMFTIVKVITVELVRDFCLVSFSDGSCGEHDFSDLITEGGAMLEPLWNPACFARAFVELGVPTWPNGFDLDAIQLHMDMAAAGELKHDAAE